MQRYHAVLAEVCKALGKSGLQLGRQVDLGHHHHHLSSRVLGQQPGRGLQIHLGFSAAGRAKQQCRPRIGIKFGQSLGLLCAQCYGFRSN